MADGLLDGLAPVMARWTMGGSAVPAAPAAWRDMLGHDAGEAQLRLLALAGQVLGTMALAEPAGELRTAPDLPRLAKPPLPASLRPRVRRILAALGDADHRHGLLALLDRRGWTMYPADWLPGPADGNVPVIYAPWQDWVARALPAQDVGEAALSQESWDHYGPAARRAAFADLRQRDPARAAEILAARIADEPPDRRLLFLDLLTGLSAFDLPVLDALANDRAPRVKARANALKARLGMTGAADEDARELAGYFDRTTTGWLRKSAQVVAQDLKTPAQRNRRSQLMQSLPLAALAEALAMAPEQLVAAWSWGGDDLADQGLAEMVARTAADDVAALVANTLAQRPSLAVAAIVPLLPRMPAAWRRELASNALDRRNATFAAVLPLAAGDGELAGTIRTGASKALLAAIKAAQDPPVDLGPALVAMGLLSSHAAAQEALDRLGHAGLVACDPRLDLLRLNAALNNEGTRP